MSTETRADVLHRIAAGQPMEQRPMYRGVTELFFEVVLGKDNGKPITPEEKLLVVAAIRAERDRLLAEAGSASLEAMEAAR